MTRHRVGEVCTLHPESGGVRYFSGHCVVCAKQKAAHRYRANKDEINARRRSSCKEQINSVRREKWPNKAAEINALRRERYATDDAYRANQLLYRKKYYQENSSKVLEANARWANSNPERVLENLAAWRVVNAETIRKNGRSRMANWRNANIEKVKEQANSPKYRAYRSARRAATKKATPAWAIPFFIEEIYSLSDLRSRISGCMWQVDHIVPLQSPLVCGLHCEANLQVILSTSNASKGNRYWPDMPDNKINGTLQ